MGQRPRRGDIPWLPAHSILNWPRSDTSCSHLLPEVMSGRSVEPQTEAPKSLVKRVKEWVVGQFWFVSGLRSGDLRNWILVFRPLANVVGERHRRWEERCRHWLR